MNNDDSPDATSDQTVRQLTPPPVTSGSAADTVPFEEPGMGGTERYQFLEEIARGGMGAVYLARDLVFDRDVGVKTLLKVPPEGSVIAARFREEARITGQLQHPNIPPVHDLGVLPDGRPYLAMKLIKGRTLEAILKARPELSHDRGQFLAIFEQIAQGVAYAHSQRIIHRDLKPLNVMVGAFGEVQVMDWGLAKVLGRAPRTERSARPAPESGTGTVADGEATCDDRDETRAGSVFGTPAYMPPEQAIGAVDRIDTRADVFGLGAVLCTVLTGKPPYSGRDAESIRQLAARAELDDAFARLDSCGAEPDLIALCKRCLSPERDDRPRDAGEVARAVADLRAEAEKRARQAELDRVRADGERAKAELRAAELRKRRRMQEGLVGAALVVMAVVVASLWWSDIKAAERKNERQQEDNRRMTEELKQQIKEDKLAAEERDRKGRNRGALVAALGRCEGALRASDAPVAVASLAEAGKRFDEGDAKEFAPRIARCRTDLPMLNELDRIEHYRWTRVRGEWPSLPAIASRWEKAFATFGLVGGPAPAAEDARRVTESLIRDRLLAALDMWLLNPSFPKNLLAVLKAADPNEYRNAVREAIFAGNIERVQALAAQGDALDQPSGFAAMLGTLRELPAVRRRAILTSAIVRDPSNPATFLVLGSTYPINQVAGAAERARCYQAVTALNPKNLTGWNHLGIALDDSGDIDGAILAYQKVLDLDKRDANAHSNLGVALRSKGDLEGALHHQRQTVDIDPNHASAHNNMGNILKLKGDLNGAIESYRKAAECNPKLALPWANLAVALDAKRDAAGSIAAYREAILRDPNMVWAYHNLGNGLLQKGDIDGAIATYREAIKRDPKYAPSCNNLGIALRRKGDLDGAAAAHVEAIKRDPKATLAHFNLGAIYLDQKKYAEAIVCTRAEIRLNPKYSNAHAMLGHLLQLTGDTDGARAALTEAVRIDKQWAPLLAKLPPVPPVAPPPREVKRP